MPRIPRGDVAEGLYNIINRGNMRIQVFDDHDGLVGSIRQGMTTSI